MKQAIVELNGVKYTVVGSSLYTGEQYRRLKEYRKMKFTTGRIALESGIEKKDRKCQS